MARRTQAQMEETRELLLTTAREHFSRLGFAATSMDEIAASVDLTRGALYHHFGDKKGLFTAVVEQIDNEMNGRLQKISTNSTNLWNNFRLRCHAYLEMALEPDYQQIILRDAKSVVAEDLAKSNLKCTEQVDILLQELMSKQIIGNVNTRALAFLINGGLAESAYWISQANSQERLQQSIQAIDKIIDGLREN
ncbi:MULTISPECIES: TetR/AcrR family transcriptional regulator [Providencia]|jgi:AcrR family transcriptional regulator|uniref:TetR/AcrR family transcriptional regulator n=1 Tax=Providencia TaxID=586 RepID=UPI001C5B11E6|nr:MULTISPECIES: TetR family transcriptional regulator [Providencia]ELR5151029.1 TetR family transcriptional regulator [Providencia rettgeri]MDR2225902.1 TetR family transcriptional regulator [Providencia sp.]QXX84129.1 TetR family transcriptional regulator [Providencia sp. R33]